MSSTAIDWTAVRLAVLIPTTRGLHPACVTALLDVQLACAKRGVSAFGVLFDETADIQLARNALARDFLDSSARFTHGLWLDDDLKFHVETVLAMLERDVDVVGAAYRMKVGDPAAVHYSARMSEEQTRQAPVRGTILVEGLGCGLLLIKRAVPERMAKAYGASLSYTDWCARRTVGLFDRLLDEKGALLGEDLAFCRRWRDVGGEIHCILDAPTEHFGRFAWPGNLAASLTRGGVRSPEPQPSRNAPCPCGSGRKFKRCHADGSANAGAT